MSEFLALAAAAEGAERLAGRGGPHSYILFFFVFLQNKKKHTCG